MLKIFLLNFKALLRAFDKHGIFKWDAIIADPTFPFRKIAQEKQKEMKEESKNAKTKEEKVEKEKIVKAEGDEEDEFDFDMYDADDIKGDIPASKKKKEPRGKKVKRKTSLLSQLELPRDTVFLSRINFLVSAVCDSIDYYTSEYEFLSLFFFFFTFYLLPKG